jgi:hypothetical protein
MLLVLPAAVLPARAQTGQATVSVAPTIAAEPASQSLLGIRVGPPEALPKGAFIRVRGLPPMAALSEGHSIAPGSWAVPIAALPSLKITLPVAAAGKSEVSVALVSIEGTVISEVKSLLIVSAAAPPAEPKSPPLSILRAGTPQQGATEPPPPTSPPITLGGASKLSPAEREQLLRLVKKGDEQLADGGIAQARLLYERAAERGLAEAAMALAATYDAAELNRLGVRGMQPDAVAAKRWYERAQQLGAAEAASRLRRLGAN